MKTRIEITATALGVLCVAFGAFMLYRLSAPKDAALLPAYLFQLKLYGGTLAGGLLMIVPTQVANIVRTVGGAAVEQWRNYKASSSSATPPTGGAS
jgi:hypothetical protein